MALYYSRMTCGNLVRLFLSLFLIISALRKRRTIVVPGWSYDEGDDKMEYYLLFPGLLVMMFSSYLVRTLLWNLNANTDAGVRYFKRRGEVVFLSVIEATIHVRYCLRWPYILEWLVEVSCAPLLELGNDGWTSSWTALWLRRRQNGVLSPALFTSYLVRKQAPSGIVTDLDGQAGWKPIFTQLGKHANIWVFVKPGRLVQCR